jgi:hypothetical protein
MMLLTILQRYIIHVSQLCKMCETPNEAVIGDVRVLLLSKGQVHIYFLLCTYVGAMCNLVNWS